AESALSSSGSPPGLRRPAAERQRKRGAPDRPLLRRLNGVEEAGPNGGIRSGRRRRGTVVDQENVGAESRRPVEQVEIRTALRLAGHDARGILPKLARRHLAPGKPGAFERFQHLRLVGKLAGPRVVRRARREMGLKNPLLDFSEIRALARRENAVDILPRAPKTTRARPVLGVSRHETGRDREGQCYLG